MVIKMKRNVLTIIVLIILFGAFVPYLIAISNIMLKNNLINHNASIDIVKNNNSNRICLDSNMVVISNINSAQLNGTTLESIAFIISFIIGIEISNYPFLSEEQKENLQQNTRSAIFTIISNNEGIHLREICRLLNKKMGVIQYHLQVLENCNLITSIKDGRYRRFFTNKTNLRNYSNKIIVSLTRRETTSKLLESIYKHNGTGIFHKELAHEVGISSQAITWHIKKLLNENIIRSEKIGRQKKYFIVDEYLDLLKNFIEEN